MKNNYVFNYPHGLDCVWVSSDELGNVSAFITAGEGPIPAACIVNDLYNLEEELLNLQKVSDALLFSNVNDTSSFTELASRGFFVYDWTDIDKPSRMKTGSYHLVSKPVSQINISDLPETLQNAARTSLFSGIDYPSVDSIDVCKYTKCSIPI